MFKLERLPMPPSVNKLYIPYRGRFIPSKHLVAYKKEVEHFHFENRLQVQKLSQDCLRIIQSGRYLHVSRTFFFQYSNVFTKKGEVKRSDLTNKIKAFDDGLASLIEIDDRFIFSSTSTKQISPDPVREWVDILISPYNLPMVS